MRSANGEEESAARQSATARSNAQVEEKLAVLALHA